MDLLKTVQEVENEFSKGIRSFHETVDELDCQIENCLTVDNLNDYTPISEPTEILSCVKKFSNATTRLLAVGRNPKNENLLQASQDTKHWISVLIETLCGTAAGSPNQQTRDQFIFRHIKNTKSIHLQKFYIFSRRILSITAKKHVKNT